MKVNDILLLVGVMILVVLLFGGPLMILWNWIMPAVFNLPTITFWQACGLQLLSTLLIKPINYKNK
jgi:hypothetical protein